MTLLRSTLASLTVAVMLTVPLASCASAGSKNQKQYVEDSEIQRPDVMLIYPFELDAGSSSQNQTYADQFADYVVRELKSRGINSRRAHGQTSKPLHALLVRGRLTSIQEGSGVERTLIGYGAGREEIRLRLTVHQETIVGEQAIVDVSGAAEGAKTPGLTTSAGVAAATGNPAGLAVGSVLTAKREFGDTLDDSFKRLAAELADRAQRYYKKQGWL